MLKWGQAVAYTGNSGPQLGIVTAVKPDRVVDLAVWEGEAWTPKLDVPRDDEPKGHTYTIVA